MNILINEHLKNNYPKLAIPTIRSYCSNVLKILNLINSNNVDDLYIKCDEIIKEVKEEYPEIGTRKCKYSSAVVYIKTLLKEDDKKNKKFNKKINEARIKYNKEIEIIKTETIEKLSKFEKTEHEKEAWITNEEQETIKNKLLSEIPSDICNIEDMIKYRNAIIFMFYMDLQSRCEVSMSKIYFDDEVKIEELDKQWNYIILFKSSQTINYIINQHKNANRKGPYTVEISNNLYNLFSKYRNDLKKLEMDNWFIFNDKGLKNMSYGELALLYASFGNIINKKISIRVNRKIATSETVKIDKLQEISRRLGHSINETIYTYAKK